jgi:hypothetical protein
VHIEGVAVPNAAAAVTDTIFTLPEGYRPFSDEVFSTVKIGADGAVKPDAAVTGTGEAIIVNAQFRPAGV